MDSNGPTASSSVAVTTTLVRAFSKTIAVTYVGLGLFGLLFLFGSLNDLYQAVVSRVPLLLLHCAVFLCLGSGFMYVILALHQRRNWARYAAVSFWLLCLIWTAVTIVRTGPHPEPAPGPLQYSNAEQLAGARRAQFSDTLFLGHIGIHRDLLLVAERERCESIQKAWPKQEFEILDSPVPTLFGSDR